MARRQHGLVTRRQLLAAGFSPKEIDRRLAKGSLIAVFRGVYRVGHVARNLEAQYLAAVLACGDGALLAGRAAAHLLGLLRGSGTRPQPLDVVTITDRQVRGVRTRRRPLLARNQAFTHRGVPVLSVPAVLVDLAGLMRDPDLARACHEAGVGFGTTPNDVEAILDRYPRSRGAASLRRVMTGETKVSLSRLESRFLRRLRDERLPLPQTNRPAGGRRVDCRWPEQRLTVELDSYRYHSSRHAWEADHRREREARLRGDEFRRFTWADVSEDPAAILAELRSLLGPSRRAGRPRTTVA